MRIGIGCLLWFPSGIVFSGAAAERQGDDTRVAWKDCLRQEDAWYQSEEAARIADNVRLYQLDIGGWPKNLDMAEPLSESERDALLQKKRERKAGTIDNGATYTQLEFLARVFNATKEERFQQAFLKGLDFLLAMQYENGGWPQSPFQSGYPLHITFNDNAMTGVMRLLREIGRGAPVYAFVDEARRVKAAAAVQKGIECILRCQVIVDGRRTAWCAQHDEKTLRPAPARSYEKISLSGSESVGVVRLLMEIDNPPPPVIEAVQGAVAWFERVKLTGIRQIRKEDTSLPGGYDKVIIEDPAAPPLWARFYEIGTNRPIFCGRDGIIKYSLAGIEHERRAGYSWYTESPDSLLAKDYPRWAARWLKGSQGKE
ncbi:MAG: pectate lyase [bacterium]